MIHNLVDKRDYQVFLTNKTINVILGVEKGVKDWEEFITEGLSV
jgi:hypothetical protein